MIVGKAKKFAEFNFWRFWSIRIKKDENTANDLFHARGTAWAQLIENLEKQISINEGAKLATDDGEKHHLFRLSNGRSSRTVNEGKQVLVLPEKRPFCKRL